METIAASAKSGCSIHLVTCSLANLLIRLNHKHGICLFQIVKMQCDLSNAGRTFIFSPLFRVPYENNDDVPYFCNATMTSAQVFFFFIRKLWGIVIYNKTEFYDEKQCNAVRSTRNTRSSSNTNLLHCCRNAKSDFARTIKILFALCERAMSFPLASMCAFQARMIFSVTFCSCWC